MADMENIDIDAGAAQLGIDHSNDDQLGFGNTIVVDHLPVVPMERLQQVVHVMKKLYNKYGVIKEDGLKMPVDPNTRMTLGYCVIEFNTNQEAQNAKEKSHGYKLDRGHIFAVHMFDDFEKLKNVRD